MANVYNTGMCKSCVYWLRNAFVGGGECRRFPKALPVGESYWCGEQKEIPEPPPVEIHPERIPMIVESKPKRGRPPKDVSAAQRQDLS